MIKNYGWKDYIIIFIIIVLVCLVIYIIVSSSYSRVQEGNLEKCVCFGVKAEIFDNCDSLGNCLGEARIYCNGFEYCFG